MNTSESVDSIIIKKNGDIQEKNVKLNELYKSCNFKISKSFEKQIQKINMIFLHQ